MRFILSILTLFVCGDLKAQYISRSEPVPYDCPVVCAGGSLILKVPQVQNFPSGTQIQAQLSNASGSFATGSVILTTVRHSFNQGGSWITGPFVFGANVNDLFLEVQVPASQAQGNNYSIRMRASTGYTSNDLFQCNGGNKVTITSGYSPLSFIGDTAWGVNRWNAHAYTWSPTVPQILNTPALVAQQSFFSPANYKGYFIKNALSFDINYTANGSKMPGPLNVLHDGTSFSCGEGYSVNYCVRFLRKHFFNPGKYLIEIAADDGVRLSIDGGQTWLLDAFVEQAYADSYKSTNSNFPGGICLNGEIKLVVEYFQRPVDARVTVRIIQLSEIAPELSHLTLCEGSSAIFSAGNLIPGASYQWESSGSTPPLFTDLVNASPFSGTQSNQLFINPLAVNLNNTTFRCRIEGVCPNPVFTDTALLKVLNDAVIYSQPVSKKVCPGDSVILDFSSDASEIIWEISSDNGASFSALVEAAPFKGTSGPRLLVFPADSFVNHLFRARVTGCAGIQFSDSVRIIPEKVISGDIIPNVITPNGDGENDVFRLRDSGISDIEIKIFNRWGYLVFDSVNNKNLEWNPISAPSAFLPGVYFYRVFYRVDCGGMSELKTGTLTVLY